MEISFRVEEPTDYRRVEEITREAFWNLYVPGATEHFLVNQLRKDASFIKELSLLAINKATSEIVGSIIYTKANILKSDGSSKEVLYFGPVCVTPEFHGKGVGKKLINESFQIALKLGYDTVIIQGFPPLYERLGFQNGYKFNISAADGTFPKGLLVKELIKDSLNGISGTFHETAIFHKIGEDHIDFEAFESSFPVKEKFATESQQAFEIVCSLQHDDAYPEGVDIERMSFNTERITK